MISSIAHRNRCCNIPKSRFFTRLIRGAENNRGACVSGCSRDSGRERKAVNSVLVYRLDSSTKSMVPLGILMDRRNEERGDNVIAMLRMARREFAGTDEEAASIFIKYEAGAADAG